MEVCLFYFIGFIGILLVLWLNYFNIIQPQLHSLQDVLFLTDSNETSVIVGCFFEQSHSFQDCLDAFDLCGSVSFYLFKPQAYTICLSRHSGLSTPYQLEHRIMVQKRKSSLFEIDKRRETVFPHQTLRAYLRRWSREVVG